MERLGMLRGVRMASVGAFVLIRRMLRLICGRRFALITVAMAIVVAYQLTDDLFISYGTVGTDSLLGIDLLHHGGDGDGRFGGVRVAASPRLACR